MSAPRASLDRVLDAVDRAGGSPRQVATNNYRARGVCHDGRSAGSLAITYQPAEGRTLVHCFGGCDWKAALEGLGLRPADCIDEPAFNRYDPVRDVLQARAKTRPKPTVATFDAAPLGWCPPVNDWVPCGHRKVAEYVYDDEDGRVCFGVTRCPRKCFCQWRPAPETPSGRRWRLREKDARGDLVAAVRLVPYRLRQLLDAITDRRPVWYVEGEKDVAALVAHGHAATTTAMGGSSWTSGYAPFFAGARLTVVADRDKTGREHAEQVVKALLPVVDSLAVVVARHGKDAFDHFQAGGTAQDFHVVWHPKKLENHP